MDKQNIVAGETIPASRKLGLTDALAMVNESSKLIICKGPKVTRFDLKKDNPSKAELEKHLLGPTGNLRAPTLRKGKTMIVGYNEEVYQGIFG